MLQKCSIGVYCFIMELVLDRKWCKDTYSIGNLYIDG
uniref:Uncharacterized protein n=1 Tax=Dulem virus 42 TaxID=3145760 RepID=A0AAU8B9B7_9CAUD